MKYPETSRRLKEALSDKGLIPQELADRTKINKASISQYINGSHSPSNKTAGLMASVLGVSPVWLMGFDVPKYDVASDSELTHKELEIIKMYRSIPEEAKERIEASLRLEYDQTMKKEGEALA